MEVIQTEDPRFVRDLHSKALLNTDRVSLENFRQRKITFARQEDEWNSIKNKVEEFYKDHKVICIRKRDQKN